MQPEHACAIIADAAGRLLLQLRPRAARHAGDQLVCFGGTREAGEEAGDCLRRELREELGRVPVLAGPGPELWRGGRFIACFTHARWDAAWTPRCEPGFLPLWAPWRALPGLPLSSWHARVLAAARRGAARVDLLDADPGWPTLPR